LVLTPEEEILVRKGREELRRGEYVTLEDSIMNWTVRLSKEAANNSKNFS